MSIAFTPTPRTAAQRAAIDEIDNAERDKWTEKQLLSEIRKVAKAHGWKTYHTHDSRKSEAGFPDLILVHEGRGRVFAWELKDATGKTSPAQDAWLTALAVCGIETDVVRPRHYRRVVEVLSGAP